MDRAPWFSNRIIDPYGLSPVRDESGVFEVGHMARYLWLGEFEHGHQIADTELSLQEKVKNSQAGLIRECLEKLGSIFHNPLPQG
jgi:hypothetical protein